MQENAGGKHVITRRLVAGGLILLGVALMVAAPNTWSGFVMLGAGIVVELVGLVLEKKESRP